jgi:hypothetical protein
MQQTDVLGEPVKNGTPKITAYESKFFKIQ